MSPNTLDERVATAKETVMARTARHDEAVALLADLRAVKEADPLYRVSQRQIPDAVLAEEVTRTDLDAVQRELMAAYASARRDILDQHRAELAADVRDVDKAYTTLVRAVKRLDDHREALVEKLGGNSELVPIMTVPFARDRQEYWRQSMSAEGLL